MSKDVIIACDFSSSEETLEFLEKMGDKRPYVKIGTVDFLDATMGAPSLGCLMAMISAYAPTVLIVSETLSPLAADEL